jgi:tetratricopeptide (TPR) repeat protein
MWHRYRGEIGHALGAYEEARAILESDGEPGDLASVLHNQASLAHLSGDLLTAQTLINQAIALRDDPNDTIDDLGVLAVVLADEDRFDDAQAVYDRARSLIIDQRGSDNPELVFLAANEAVLSHRRGYTDEAELRYREALGASERILGIDHPHTGEVLANLAAFHEAADNQDEAHRLATRAISILTACVDVTHPSLQLARAVHEASRASTALSAE